MAEKLLLLLLLIILSLLHACSGSIVKFLPGFEGPLTFELETGYIGVGEEEKVQLFYYFIKSEKNPKEDPLLIWLSGGPGCSSFTGLFFENGPVTFKVEEGYNEGIRPALLSTTHSWTKVANIIFLDQPVGTGFSYAKTQLLDTPSDSGEAKQIHEFIRKWLSKHTEFISNPFYVAGDSYSGKTIPATVQEISKGNDLGLKPRVNLEGYVLGNPVTDFEFDHNHAIPFAHGMALISDELYESLKRSCRGNYENIDPHNTECLKHHYKYLKCISSINVVHILMPRCDPPLFLQRKFTLLRNVSAPLIADGCYKNTDLLSSLWANDESVRKALHVVKGSIGKWVRCSSGKPYDYDIKSSVPYHMNNTLKGYRSLIFSGDHDLTVPFLSTQAWITSLGYSIIDDWRPWMVQNQIAGYTRTYANNMTYATVKGGGHTLEFKPNESFIMFQRWINDVCLSRLFHQDSAAYAVFRIGLVNNVRSAKKSICSRDSMPGYSWVVSGVTCWHNDENRVLRIKLSGYGLEGEFPSGIMNCTGLVDLDLSRNNFHGALPSNMASFVPLLTKLDLSYNQFSGEIPDSLSDVKFLNILMLQHNQFSTGQIPPWLASLLRLYTFSVADNQLTGPVPTFNQTTVIIGPENFANNDGLCGRPMDACVDPEEELIGLGKMGAAVGAALFVPVAVFLDWFVFNRKKKKLGDIIRHRSLILHIGD